MCDCTSGRPGAAAVFGDANGAVLTWQHDATPGTGSSGKLTVLASCGSRICCLAVIHQAPDEQQQQQQWQRWHYLLAGCADGRCILLGATSGRTLAQWSAHAGPVQSLKLLSTTLPGDGNGSMHDGDGDDDDGRCDTIGAEQQVDCGLQVVSGGADCTIKLWEMTCSTQGTPAEASSNTTSNNNSSAAACDDAGMPQQGQTVGAVLLTTANLPPAASGGAGRPGPGRGRGAGAGTQQRPGRGASGQATHYAALAVLQHTTGPGGGVLVLSAAPGGGLVLLQLQRAALETAEQ